MVFVGYDMLEVETQEGLIGFVQSAILAAPAGLPPYQRPN
jgi:hypothetical protein